MGVYPIRADITVTGDINPAYPGSDPWKLERSDANLSKENLNIGYTGTGTLRIDGHSTIFSQSGYIGRKAGSDGSVTVSGPDAVWDNSRSTVVGSQGAGTLHILEGGTVNSGDYRAGYIGTSFGSVGVATVSGAGSTWNNAGQLVIGSGGTGTLNLADGAVVNVDKDTIITERDIGQGVIHFSGGVLNTGGLMTDMTDLLGSGTINTAGLVSDLDLVFDSSTGLQQQILLNSLPGQNITINIDSDNPDVRSALGAGYQGAGTLTVADGLNVHSELGYLGYKSGSSGTVNVAGPGSAWVIDRSMYVGYYGAGVLRIENGGTVNAGTRTIGYYGEDTHSTAVITGAASVWNGWSLQVGTPGYGAGTLSIRDGGTVSAHTSSIMNGSATVTGPGSTWSNSLDLKIQGGNSLSILDGAHVSNVNGLIGFDTHDDTEPDPEGTVTVTVSGAGSNWTNTGRLEIGRRSSQPGILRIENGAAVHVGQKTQFYPYGSGDSAIIFNDGTLYTQNLLTNARQIRGSGTVHTAGLISDLDVVFDATTGLTPKIVLNSQPGQNVTIHLDAADPSVDRLLGAGFGGGGSLTIKDGVVVSGSTGYVGYQSWQTTASARVTGPGSAWHNTGTLSVGYDGFGELVVDQGGQVTSANGSVAYYEGTVGVATIAGPGSAWINAGDMNVGNYYNTGTLNVRDRARVEIGGKLVVGGSDSIGTLNIENGSFVSVSGGIKLAIANPSSGTINLTGGTLDLNGGEITKGTKPWLGDATFNFTGGTFENFSSITLGRAFTQSGGVLSPGGENGLAYINDGYHLSAGTLRIEFGGEGDPHDQLIVRGGMDIASLGTVLDISALGPMKAGTYTIIRNHSGGEIMGMFESVVGIGAFPGWVDVQYSPTAVTMTLTRDYVPEPGSLVLLGLCALSTLRRVG